MADRSLTTVLGVMRACASAEHLQHRLTPAMELNYAKSVEWRARERKEHDVWEAFHGILEHAYRKALHTPPEAMTVRWTELADDFADLLNQLQVPSYQEVGYRWFVNAYNAFLGND